MTREQARYYAQMILSKEEDGPGKVAVQQLVEESNKLDQIEQLMIDNYSAIWSSFVFNELKRIMELEIDPWKGMKELEPWKSMK